MEDIIEEFSSNKSFSLDRSIIDSNSFNINSDICFNNLEQSDINNNNDYKIENFDFFQENESLSLYYENFYQ